MTITVIPQPPPPREVVAFQHKSKGHVYVPGSVYAGSGYWDAKTGLFSTASYSEKLFTDDGVKHYYTPIYKGDKIVITKEITL